MNRREMLRASGVVAGAAAMKAVAQNSPGLPQPAWKNKIVITGGHPGDPEYGCGGTVARLTALGHEVVLLYMNDGAWQEISAPVRIAEAKKACEILKATLPMRIRSTDTQLSTMNITGHFRKSSKWRTRMPFSRIGSSITILTTGRSPI